MTHIKPDPKRPGRVYFTQDALSNTLAYGQDMYVVFECNKESILFMDNKGWGELTSRTLLCFMNEADAEEYRRTGELTQLEF